MIRPGQVFLHWEASGRIDPFSKGVSMWGEASYALKVEACRAEVGDVVWIGGDSVEGPDRDGG